MKRIGLICLLMMVCSLPGYSQFWISFGWNEPHCQSCGWMEEALRLSPRKAAQYHKIIHTYGQRIEREARRDCRHWDKSASKIYTFRMQRDRKIQRLLTPAQFALYVRFVREHPQRIHDYRGWYRNPHYPHYRPSLTCTRYEDNYWRHDWGHGHHHGEGNRPVHRPHYDHGRPAHPHHPVHHERPSDHRKHKDKKYKVDRERGRSYGHGRERD